jgi:GWxTD domain-containing protein
MMALTKHKFWLAFLLLATLTGCRQWSGVSTLDLSYLYEVRPDRTAPLQSVAFNISDSITTLYVRLRSDILVRELGPEPEFPPVMRYSLFTAYENGTMVDSGSVAIEWPLGETGAWTNLQLDLPVVRGQWRLCQFEVNGLPGLRHLCTIDRTRAFGRHDILLTDPAGEPLFDHVIRVGQQFRIAIPQIGAGSLRYQWLSPGQGVALPPFAFQREQATDRMPGRTVNISVEDGLTPVLMLDTEGLFHFSKENKPGEEFFLLCLSEPFPVVNSAEKMLSPLQYITTSQEFADLQAIESPKLAIDRFWLGVTGNVGRARLRIREYYERIEQANTLFTTSQEGWTTDRGIIYVVYGPPKVVYRTDKTEKWIYGEAGNAHSLKFVFSRADASLFTDEYRLNRSPVYKESWYNAVEAWRR